MKKITLLLTLIFFQLITYSQINSSSFQASVQFPVGTKPEDVSIGDLDLDGKIDIVTCNSTTHNISVLRNQSTVGVINPASFASAVQFNLISGDTPYGIDVGDIDGDGKPEIVTANRYGDSISVFLNATTPGVINASSFATRLNFHAPQYCRDIIVADFDGDGKNDIAAVGQFVFSVWRNTSTVGNISFATRYDLSHTGNLGMGIAAGDLDGDGMKDIIIAATRSSSTGQVRYFRNQGVPGGIAFIANGYSSYLNGFQSHDVTLADFNGDGKLDVLTCAERQLSSISSMWVATNASTIGNIQMVQFQTLGEIPGGTQYGGQGVGAADIDGDGAPEALNIRPSFSGVNMLRVRRNIHDFVGDSIHLDDFEPYVQFAGGNGGGYLNYSRMRTGDFDGDGKIDAVLTNDGSNNVSVFMNTSSTTNTITTSSTVDVVTCSGAAINVPFTCNAPFTGSNVFSAELSDATGSFASPTVIGTLSSTVSGTINATIPGGTPAGNNYRIRVVSSDPVIVGTDNGIDITIGGTPVSVSIAISPSDSVCAGTSVTFTATPVNGGSSPSYQWRRNATNVGTNSPTYITTSYTDNDVFTCIMTSNIGGCATGNPATSNPITMTVTPLASTPSVISGANSICENSSNTYSVTNVTGVTYNWGLPTGWTGSSTTNSINTTAGTTGGNISVSASNGCGTSSIRTLNVSVNPLPNIVVSGNTSICDGDATTLTATGASSYAWDNGVGTGASVSVSPTSTTTYTVTGTDANSCSNTAQVTVTVNPLPSVVATGTATICDGDATTLTATGASSYAWDNGAGTGASVSVSPTSTTTYTVTGTDANSCSNTAQVTVTVNPLPSVVATGTATICDGDATTLTATGASSYAWDNGAGTGASVSVSPTLTTTYTVTGTDANSCSNTAQVTVTVNPLPSMVATGTATICAGDATTLTATGANSYTWDNGAGTGASVSVSPTSTTTYTVTGTDANSCSNTAQVTVTVNPLPSVVATGTATICDGDATTLTATGASSYTWDNGAGTSASVAVSPTSTTTYTVTGTDANSCSNTDQVTVTVNPLPSVVATGAATICAGDATTLTATGASSYTWDNGAGTSASVAVSPTSTTTYTVIGTDANSCSNTAQVTVTVNPLPTVVYTQTPNIVCENDAPFALTGGSPSGGVYSGTGVNAGSFDPAVAGAGTHTITYAFTDGNNCSDSDTQQIQVDVCAGIDEQASQLVTIYPNPFKNEFTVSFTTNGNHTIELFNVLGEQFKLVNVYEQNTVINTDDLPSGVYFLRIVDEKLIFKLLKN